ncbi:MAG: DNA mismatch repair protein MutS [Candidatus Margulisbacteria bacterium]|nr:DNA mismatch repair protein MutS [Candidatus Margulisiibacteriota bacterium]MBU1021116.1 DNA mismatch repair protein MutS [Candidatus Margulisiibacteriota bacterium]MBU1728671.1 DNA mismatch repair protein MutS [Candidatus Margulisiibacteriota bacterium]MBU1955122.1 DNA mismatch repair protein MutS [Candidatus Margulisiibacteriota bacterium]
MADQTPMVKQYHEIKSRYQDAILFFRLGDFYEMFYDDALLASRELEITLTGRGHAEKRMPMCGFPHHAADNYIAKLIDRGYKVAICEQVEDPSVAKGVVRRDVVKVVTKGTTLDANMLPAKKSNYLVAVSVSKKQYGIAVLEASTGEFKVCVLDMMADVLGEVGRLNPSEILISDMIKEKDLSDYVQLHQIPQTVYKDTYDVEVAADKLKILFKVKSLDSFGMSGFEAALPAAAKIVDYLQETQKTALSHINSVIPYQLSDFMFIDAPTRKNLELVETVRDKSFRGSLLWVLDQTGTSMGSRLLRSYLLAPLLKVSDINRRLDGVAELAKDTAGREELSRLLNDVFDIERLTGKVASSQANARDLVSLKSSLENLPKFRNALKNRASAILKSIAALPDLNDIVLTIAKAIEDNPPFTIKEGGIIKKGYSAELDELKDLAKGGKDWILALEDAERKRTGIKSLKVGFNKVFGYYIDVSKSNLDKVPENYIRKQTLVNNERFITPDLKEKESFILNADQRLKEMEYKVFCDIREQLKSNIAGLKSAAEKLATLDVLLSFANVAVYSNYVRPSVNESSEIILKGSRHPVIEKTLGEHKFVKNNIQMLKDSRFLLITGPNMAGKSTGMRQVALCCLLAQIGSFIPADSAEIGITDRIFTRIGAMDDIFSGQSTFMLEMTETANILFNATEKSLIILDEIGRGTSTFDGMSIAAAVAEYIHNKIKAKTMFATHYHEITQLADKHEGMQNMNVAVKEEGDHITFLYKLVKGPADQSYGIQVARLAGLPTEVIKRAKEVYGTLEMVENNLGQSKKAQSKKTKTKNKDQMGLF